MDTIKETQWLSKSANCSFYNPTTLDLIQNPFDALYKRLEQNAPDNHEKFRQREIHGGDLTRPRKA